METNYKYRRPGGGCGDFWSGGRGNVSLGEREGRLFFCIDRSGGEAAEAGQFFARLCVPNLHKCRGHSKGRGQFYFLFQKSVLDLVVPFLQNNFRYLMQKFNDHWMQHSIAFLFLQRSLGRTCHLWCKIFKNRSGYYFVLVFFIPGVTDKTF